MTNKELKQKAIALSGRPARKNKLGFGAYRWLAIQLDVHPSTVARWIRGTSSDIPEWVDEEIEKLEQRIASGGGEEHTLVERRIS
jgi:transposase-like protein